MLVDIKNPKTFFVKIKPGANRFSIRDSSGRIYFYRDLPAGCKYIKVNVPDTGVYLFDDNSGVTSKPIEINKNVYKIKLPERERNFNSSIKIKHDDSLTDSPAIIYAQLGLIITGKKFKELTKPFSDFILLHEKGHQRYKTEEYCDLYALIEFVKKGGNPSTAMYCLMDVLRKKPQNDKRIRYIYNILERNSFIK